MTARDRETGFGSLAADSVVRGSVTVTVRTTTRIAGSFAFDAVPTSGSGPARRVTEGRFDAQLSP